MASTITQTTLNAKAGTNATVINVVSATGISAPVANFRQKLYIINPDTTRGNLVEVVGVSGTYVTISALDKYKQDFIGPTGNGGVGATVLIGPTPDNGAYSAGLYQGSFQEDNPVGSTGLTYNSSTNQPWVNVDTGEQWIYSTVTGLWVPGWNNPSAIKGVTAAVASAAGQITPSGPLFHITGALAITGFVQPIGFSGGSFTVIPDGTFTWTAANNIALAGTAVVSRAITFTYDSNTGKWYPSSNVSP